MRKVGEELDMDDAVGEGETQGIQGGEPIAAGGL